MDAQSAVNEYTADLLAGRMSVSESVQRIEHIRHAHDLTRKDFRTLFLDEFSRQSTTAK